MRRAVQVPFSARILKGGIEFPRPRTAFAVGKPPYATMRRTVQLLNTFDDSVMVERIEIAVPPASPPSESSSSGTTVTSSKRKRGEGAAVEGTTDNDGGAEMFSLGSFEPTALANTETVALEMSFLPTSEKSIVRRELRAFTNLSSMPFVLPVYSYVSPPPFYLFSSSFFLVVSTVCWCDETVRPVSAHILVRCVVCGGGGGGASDSDDVDVVMVVVS